MDFEIRKINKDNQDLKKVKELFISAFPKEERIAFWFLALAAKIKEADFLSFHDKDVFCGMTCVSAIDNITFILYLAVSPEMRSKGYGSAILSVVQSMYKDNKIILYMDKCDENALDNEQRLRRQKFYKKNGYEKTGYLVKTRKIVQEVLIKNGKFSKDEFEQFLKKQTNGLVRQKFYEASERY